MNDGGVTFLLYRWDQLKSYKGKEICKYVD